MSERILVHEVTLDGYKATADHKTLDFGTWGSYGIEKLHLNLGKAWEGLVVTAHFNVKGEAVATALADVDNMIQVPWEATKESTFSGNIVFEGAMNGQRRMTANQKFKVTNHADFTGSDPAPSDDKWNQFVTETKNYREDAMDAAERAMQTETEVGALGDEKKQALQEESEKQQEAIEKKGKDTLASIPEDYADLSEDVGDLKSDTKKINNFLFVPIFSKEDGLISIYLETGSVFTVATVDGTAFTNARLYFYDKNKNNISGSGWELNSPNSSRKITVYFQTSDTVAYYMSTTSNAPIKITYISAGDELFGIQKKSNEAVTELSKIKSYSLLDRAYISEPLELGNIVISDGWYYRDSVSRVRTPENTTVTLGIGDIIGLTDYSNARFYLGWISTEGVYGAAGWLTKDYEITVNGEYVILISNINEVQQTDGTALSSLLKISKIFHANEHSSGKEIDDKLSHFRDILLEIPFEETNGFINSAGDVEYGTSDEKYTNQLYLPVNTTVTFSGTFSTTRSIWVAICLYDKSGKFLLRSVLVNKQDKHFNCQYTLKANEYSLRLTYRTYGDLKATLISNASIYNQILTYSDHLKSALDSAVVYGNQNIKSVNHRGYNTVAPENTISAFKLSKKMGFDYVETDVSFTSDGVAVCLHDSTIDRTSNGTGNISNLTFAEVRNFDFGSWKSQDYAGEKIPSFDEFVLLCKNLGLHPYIELKSNSNYSNEQIYGLVDVVKKYGMKGKVSWISFNVNFLKTIKEYDEKARLGYIVGAIAETSISGATQLKTEGNEVFIDAEYDLLTDDAVALSVAADIPLEVWTVNTSSALYSLDAYVSGVTSDSLLSGNLLVQKELD